MTKPKGIVSTGTVLFADPSALIERQGWNPRFDFGDLSEIEKSMKAEGYKRHKPLLVRKLDAGRFEIVDGYRRNTVIQKLVKSGFSFDGGIPIVVAPEGLSEMQLLAETLTSNNGKLLLPLEEAAAYDRMRRGDPEKGVKGLTLKQMVQLTGKSDMHISDTLSLIDADPELKDALSKGQLGSTLAKQIAIKARGDTAEQKKLVAKAKTGKKGVAEVKEDLKRKKLKNFTKGPVVKAQRVLTANRLETLDEEIQVRFKELLEANGSSRGRIKAFVKESDERALCYAAGLLRGIQVARGVETDTSS